jgi:ligand-binding sensor domain-containing protein/serine phosphatase RsbU (regulator of sigma subunit)
MMYCRGILPFIFLILSSHLFSQNYSFRNFGQDDRLPQPYIYSLIQDDKGFLWIGTGNGLSKYNGFTFENYSTADSLADNFITCSINDGNKLWFGHMNGRLTCYDGNKFHPAGIGQPNMSPVTHFAKDPLQRIWVSTFSDGLLELGEGFEMKKHEFTGKNPQVVTFDFLSNNELIIGTNTGILVCQINEQGKIDIIRKVEEIPGSRITCILRMRDGKGFYIATENDGIYRFINHDEKSYGIDEIFPGTGFDLTGIQNIYEDSQSNIWLASFGNGLIKLTPGVNGSEKMKIYKKSEGFLTDNVKIVYEDREGIIWSGSYGDGLTQLIPRSFTVWRFDPVLYGNSVLSICPGEKHIWIGTDKGIIKADISTGRIIKFFSIDKGLPEDAVTSIYSTDGIDLWIGTERNGVFRMKPGDETMRRYPVSDEVLENSITAITGKSNRVWVGTKKGLCCINSETGKLTWYTIHNGGLPHNFINSLFLDTEGRLWVSSKSGILAYIENEKVIKIPLSTGNGILSLGPVTQDNDSRIWVGSNGNGLFLIESDTAANFTTREGLLSDYCYSLISDNDQHIWVVHKNGLSRIRTTDFSVKPVKSFEDLPEDFSFNQNAVNIDNEKNIWFGTDRGLILYDPSEEFPYLEPPVLGITSVRINDIETVCPENKIILRPGKYKIRIDYIGISLKEPSLVTYQYKLDGYDEWSDITGKTSITYDNLSEGKYNFILRASSGDGAITQNPVTLSILIKKAVWEKWWFYPLCTLILITFIIVYTKSREQKLETEKEILEDKVRERTCEIESQKNEIALQRDTIDEKNASITSSIIYASNIQKSVLPPWEMINKLLPDNFILNKPKDIVSGDFYWLAEKNNRIVFTVADCTGHGVPGAFMSILGIALLNEIVNTHGITRSDDIVTNLREKVIQSLQQNRKDEHPKDGMDISLCVLDRYNKKIQFTGGMNDMVYIRDYKLNVLKADRYSVGVFEDYPGFFSMKEIEYHKGDVFYLFSDGYQDQFGGDFDKKFLRKSFYLTLLEIHGEPMAIQKKILEEKLLEWMKNNSQTDDITVMGIRL